MGTTMGNAGRKVEIEEMIAFGCDSPSCPTVYTTKSGSILVQGFSVDDAGFNVPEGESVVELPASLIAEAARRLAAREIDSRQ